jgi:branched-chain amino acid aminotransferase
MSIAYLNGRYVPLREAGLPVWDRGVVQGVTITERLRTFQHKPFLVGPHLDRLERSLTALRLTLPERRHEMIEIIDSVVEHEVRLLDASKDLGLVIFVTAGPVMNDAGEEQVEQRRTTCVHPAPLPFKIWADRYAAGQRLIIPDVQQMPPEVIDPQIKYRSRLHWFLADQAAHEIDPQTAALLVTRDGRLTETSTGNLFLVRNGELFTPSPEITLTGISQTYVQGLAHDLGIPTHVADLNEDDLWTVEEAFLTSTSFCLMPVTSVNNRPIGPGHPGPIADRLLMEWSHRVGVNIRAQAERWGHP